MVAGAIVKKGAGGSIDGYVGGVVSSAEEAGTIDGERACADRSVSGIGVVAREDEGAGAGFGDITSACKYSITPNGKIATAVVNNIQRTRKGDSGAGNVAGK